MEMTTKRSRRDFDEVYPAEELHDNFGAYQPATRRQNRGFAVGVVCFVIAFGALFGAKVYMVPGEDVELEPNAIEQGTVSNNADNSKVAEALRDNKQMPAKKPHSSSYAQGSHEKSGELSDKDDATTDREQPNDEVAELEQNEDTDAVADKPHKHNGKEKDKKLNDWHKIRVSKSDRSEPGGPMYEVLEVLSHNPKSFTEGLTYHDDKLYESVGLKGQSNVLVLDPNTGDTLQTYKMKSKYFGEGLTYDGHGHLYQLTYKAKLGFIYDIHDLSAPPKEFRYETTTGEGWGFTYDKKHDEFIVSDGSAFLHVWDRETLKQVRKHQIMRLNGRQATNINELEMWRDRVVANVWFERVLLIINPKTGLVEKEYDFSGIWDVAGEKANSKAEVFNGISVSDDPDVLYVTGKWWSKMFKVKLLPEIES